jgi:3-oxoacyl-[acyl-carrier protein] reductase
VTLAPFEMTGRTAVVTGAGSGIGRSTAVTLAACGAELVCADIVADSAAATAELIQRDGGQATSEELDVASEESFEALLQETAARAGHLDVLVNVAGVGEQITAIADLADEVVERVMAVNLMGTFYGCRAAARVMSAQGHGAIVNVASSVVDTPEVTGLTAYGMSKAGVVQLTRTLAYELGPVGVRVNAVSPGFILTPHSSRHFTDSSGHVDQEKKDTFLARFRGVSPLGEIGMPEDVAWSILFLASDAARFMTGQVLRPNGGQAMPG